MVAWSTDGVLAALAYASTLVATLRAGSRALYLLEHDHIDVIEGPPILGPNETAEAVSPLWELTQLFQQSVRLALDPEHMEFRVLVVNTPQEKVRLEPYSLSPWPTKKKVAKESAVPVFNASDVEDPVCIEVDVDGIVSARSYEKLSKEPSFLSRVTPRNVLHRVPWAKRWMAEDFSEDESFHDDDEEGTYRLCPLSS